MRRSYTHSHNLSTFPNLMSCSRVSVRLFFLLAPEIELLFPPRQSNCFSHIRTVSCVHTHCTRIQFTYFELGRCKIFTPLGSDGNFGHHQFSNTWPSVHVYKKGRAYNFHHLNSFVLNPLSFKMSFSSCSRTQQLKHSRRS